MLSYKKYKVGEDDLDVWMCIQDYIDEHDIKDSHIILHCATGDPLVFFKLYVAINKDSVIIDRCLGVWNCDLLIYGYTYIEEVPITHCEVKGERIC